MGQCKSKNKKNLRGGRGLKPPSPGTPLDAKVKKEEKGGRRRGRKRKEAPLGSGAGSASD